MLFEDMMCPSFEEGGPFIRALGWITLKFVNISETSQSKSSLNWLSATNVGEKKV